MRNIKLLAFTGFFFTFLSTQLKADEGMWMLSDISKIQDKISDCGCEMSPEEIYNPDSISLKDAVIVFGGGCTGVIVSDQGLLFTNHHCGYSAIQSLSDPAHNYLMDGYVANEAKDELACEGLSVKILAGFKNITDRYSICYQNNLNKDIFKNRLDSVDKLIKSENPDKNDTIYQIKSFYKGNQHFLFRYAEFRDIRLAFTAPHAIGKFGGDTDNWMWPRHTGDFSVFRIYSDSLNRPAGYSASNRPYVPSRHSIISLNGYKPDDYAMILGNPGSTDRYHSSWAIQNRMKTANAARIEVRGVKQDIWKSYMKENPATRLAYASKFARSSNYWKNSIGMNAAIEKLKVIELKQKQEADFRNWSNLSEERRNEYDTVLDQLKNHYEQIERISRAIYFLRESFFNGAEITRFANSTARMSAEELSSDSIRNEVLKSYKDYREEVDKSTMKALLKFYKQSVEEKYLPTEYLTIDKSFGGNIDKYVDKLFAKSAFANAEELKKRFNKNQLDFSKDPALILYKSCDDQLSIMRSLGYEEHLNKIGKAERLYVKGLMEISQEKGKVTYPDANSTMRLTYGKIGGYSPKDGEEFKHYTTTRGILEKEIAGDMEFDVPAILKEKILAKDFGKYADDTTGEMHVAFLSNNDITGGNSGSPIFNAKGELLGLAFDGNWEAMSGDLVFDANLQRTINVDVRYMLFIMDKVYNANRLIKELNL